MDCLALYQVVKSFMILIQDKFNLDIKNYPTLPSLAFNLFNNNYANKNKNFIHQLSGKISEDIRKGYTGGSTEMYIPSLDLNKKIYAYDVNSLYPFVMKNFKYPVGSPTYFEGNILKTDPNSFGFFYCKIVAPDNLLHPILQLHHKTDNGTRTISPLGNWQGWYFSE